MFQKNVQAPFLGYGIQGVLSSETLLIIYRATHQDL
jgi:hypothetical protein